MQRKSMGKEAYTALGVAGIILAGIFMLPLVVVLYCVPSIRAAFDQLAYEDAMRG